VEVQMLTAAEKAEFAKATRAVYDKWVPTVGADLVKMAESAIARRG
jgi:TRAP-type C4-dicarboxylate transport system substrate-binding protein